MSGSEKEEIVTPLTKEKLLERIEQLRNYELQLMDSIERKDDNIFGLVHAAQECHNTMNSLVAEHENKLTEFDKQLVAVKTDQLEWKAKYDLTNDECCILEKRCKLLKDVVDQYQQKEQEHLDQYLREMLLETNENSSTSAASRSSATQGEQWPHILGNRSRRSQQPITQAYFNFNPMDFRSRIEQQTNVRNRRNSEGRQQRSLTSILGSHSSLPPIIQAPDNSLSPFTLADPRSRVERIASHPTIAARPGRQRSTRLPLLSENSLGSNQRMSENRLIINRPTSPSLDQIIDNNPNHRDESSSRRSLTRQIVERQYNQLVAELSAFTNRYSSSAYRARRRRLDTFVTDLNNQIVTQINAILERNRNRNNQDNQNNDQETANPSPPNATAAVTVATTSPRRPPSSASIRQARINSLLRIHRRQGNRPNPQASPENAQHQATPTPTATATATQTNEVRSEPVTENNILAAPFQRAQLIAAQNAQINALMRAQLTMQLSRVSAAQQVVENHANRNLQQLRSQLLTMRNSQSINQDINRLTSGRRRTVGDAELRAQLNTQNETEPQDENANANTNENPSSQAPLPRPDPASTQQRGRRNSRR